MSNLTYEKPPSQVILRYREIGSEETICYPWFNTLGLEFIYPRTRFEVQLIVKNMYFKVIFMSNLTYEKPSSQVIFRYREIGYVEAIWYPWFSTLGLEFIYLSIRFEVQPTVRNMYFKVIFMSNLGYKFFLSWVILRYREIGSQRRYGTHGSVHFDFKFGLVLEILQHLSQYLVFFKS